MAFLVIPVTRAFCELRINLHSPIESQYGGFSFEDSDGFGIDRHSYVTGTISAATREQLPLRLQL